MRSSTPTSLILLLFVCCSSAFAGLATAQDVSAGNQAARSPETAVMELDLTDGSVVYGRVETSEPDRVVFKTLSGTSLDVDRERIRSLQAAEGRIVDGEFQPADPNGTRLFFGPTARSLKRGEGYLSVYEVVLPFVQVGLTDRVSFGIGTPLVFGGGGDRPVWISPKVQLHKGGRFSAAVGLLHFTNIGDSSIGIAYAITTYGTRDSAISAGLGYGYARGGNESGRTTLAMIGGEHRISKRVAFVTENYIWSGSGILSAGVRFFGDHLSTDLGLMKPVDVDVVAPVVNFVWSF